MKHSECLENRLKAFGFKVFLFLLEITLAQVALVWGDNDVLVEPEDLERIKKEIPNIVMNFKVSFTNKIHLFLS